MSKYYRKATSQEVWDGKAKFTDEPLMPVEVDTWHPASESPKPKDFEPLGYIEAIMPEGNPWHWRMNDGSHPLPMLAIHWRKITPPK